VIRTIRFLGAALGGLIGIVLVISQLAVFEPVPGAVVLEIAWVVAWIVLGFTLLPYLTVIPAQSAVRAVQQLSTAEFVTAIIGLFLGLLLGLLLGLPLGSLDPPISTVAPLGISIFLGLAMVGLTVAKRHDLIAAAESIGLIRRVQTAGEGGGVPRILVDTSAIWRCRASCWTRSSASPTAPTRFAGPVAGVAWRSLPACARPAPRRSSSSTRTSRERRRSIRSSWRWPRRTAAPCSPTTST
jgi:uncharacterized protein YacL